VRVDDLDGPEMTGRRRRSPLFYVKPPLPDADDQRPGRIYLLFEEAGGCQSLLHRDCAGRWKAGFDHRRSHHGEIQLFAGRGLIDADLLEYRARYPKVIQGGGPRDVAVAGLQECIPPPRAAFPNRFISPSLM
jgi:hypothetical protein